MLTSSGWQYSDSGFPYALLAQGWYRASVRRPTSCRHQSTTGLPRALTLPTCCSPWH